jgi:hypothetical protein
VRRSPSRARPRPPRRSAAPLAVAAAALALALVAPAGRAAPPRFTGEVTDTLRAPAHRLVADAKGGKASADLVFSDATHARTAVRTCVKRRDAGHVRTCFRLVTGAAGVATVTPLRFPRGHYDVRWSVGGAVVAHWRVDVV